MEWYGNSQLSMLSLQICSSWGYLLNFMAQVRTRVSLGGKQSYIRGYVRGLGHLNVLLASLTWPCTWFSCCCTARCSGLGWSSVGRSPGKGDNHNYKILPHIKVFYLTWKKYFIHHCFQHLTIICFDHNHHKDQEENLFCIFEEWVRSPNVVKPFHRKQPILTVHVY